MRKVKKDYIIVDIVLSIITKLSIIRLSLILSTSKTLKRYEINIRVPILKLSKK